jgi:hypothetical protein
MKLEMANGFISFRSEKMKGSLKFSYTDDWGRNVYVAGSGNKYIDVDGELYTMTEDWGEPCTPTGRKTEDFT